MLPLDRRADVGGDGGAVAGNEHARAERDHRRVDGDHAHAHREARSPSGPGRWYATASTTSVRVPAPRPSGRRSRGVAGGAARRRRRRARARAPAARPGEARSGALRGPRPRLDPGQPRAGGVRPPPDRRDRRALRRPRRSRAATAASCPALGVCELASRAGEARELVLQRARAGPELGREAAIREGGALELVDPGEHRGERAGPEDDRYRVGVALDVEAPQEGRDPRVRRRERATDDRDVAVASARASRRAPAGVARAAPPRLGRGPARTRRRRARASPSAARRPGTRGSRRGSGAPDGCRPRIRGGATAVHGTRYRARPRTGPGTVADESRLFADIFATVAHADVGCAARLPDLWPVTPPSAGLSTGERDAA